MDFEKMPTNHSLVCHIYDTVSEQHQPFFIQPNINAALRAARAVTKDMTQKEFRLVIDGEWHERAGKTPFQPMLEPIYYNITTGTSYTWGEEIKDE